jgi:hypothetical protein
MAILNFFLTYKEIECSFWVGVLLEYIRSLSFYQVSVEYDIYKLVISVLVRAGRWYQLHQLLQYHIIGDGLPIACQLLSLQETYPPTYQLALDMLKRLASSDPQVNNQIVEVLLTTYQVALLLI